MFQLFRRRTEKRSIFYPAWDWLGKQLGQQQRKWADYLNRLAEKTSRRRMWGLLFLFCIFFGSGGIYALVSAFQKKAESPGPERLSLPAFTLPTNATINQHTPAVFSQGEIQYLNWLRGYLDSLQKSGSQVYDSIILVNPDLMDNLTKVEGLLSDQIKIK